MKGLEYLDRLAGVRLTAAQYADYLRKKAELERAGASPMEMRAELQDFILDLSGDPDLPLHKGDDG